MKKICFKKEFTSPIFGDVWLGRIVECKEKIADQMIDRGYAYEVDEVNRVSDINRSEEPSADSPKRRGRPSK